MKLILSLAFLASIAPNVFAFAPSNPAFVGTSSPSASSTILEASKNKAKLASRGTWAEKRGIGKEGAVDKSGSDTICVGEEGLKFVKLTNGSSSSEVYLLGGVVTSYVNDGVEYIAVRPDAKMDGSKPISGGLSHCFPQVNRMFCRQFDITTYVTI